MANFILCEFQFSKNKTNKKPMCTWAKTRMLGWRRIKKRSEKPHRIDQFGGESEGEQGAGWVGGIS